MNAPAGRRKGALKTHSAPEFGANSAWRTRLCAHFRTQAATDSPSAPTGGVLQTFPKVVPGAAQGGDPLGFFEPPRVLVPAGLLSTPFKEVFKGTAFIIKCLARHSDKRDRYIAPSYFIDSKSRISAISSKQYYTGRKLRHMIHGV